MDGQAWASVSRSDDGLVRSPCFFSYPHFFFYCFSGVRNGKTKKTYSYAFCLSLSVSLAVRLGTQWQNITSDGAQVDRRKHPSLKPILRSIIVHKFLNVEGKSELVLWDQAVAEVYLHSPLLVVACFLYSTRWELRPDDELKKNNTK